jgi:5-methylcytosine-specific restriction protein A
MREPYHIESTLTKSQWVEVLLNKDITYSKDLEILQAMYGFEEYKAAAGQIGKLVGYTGKSAGGLNLEIGRYGKRVIGEYPVRLTKRVNGSEQKWDIFFNGWQEGKFFIWQLKKDLREALVETGLTGEIHYSEEIYEATGLKLFEGAKK